MTMALKRSEVAQLQAWGWELSPATAPRPDAIPDRALVPIEWACNAIVSPEACR